MVDASLGTGQEPKYDKGRAQDENGTCQEISLKVAFRLIELRHVVAVFCLIQCENTKNLFKTRKNIVVMQKNKAYHPIDNGRKKS